MNSNMNHLFIWILVITVLGCTPRPEPSVQLDNPDLISRLNSANVHGFPDQFNAIHHTVLNLAGKSYVLNGYLKIDRLNQSIHFNAQSELGGTVFTMFLKNGVPLTIDIQLEQFKKEWLEKSVAQDLKYLYFNSRLINPKLKSLESGELILSNPVIRRQHEEKIFFRIPGSPDYRIKTYQRLEKNKPYYSITYHYGNEQKNRLPESLTLINKDMHYTLHVNVRYFL